MRKDLLPQLLESRRWGLCKGLRVHPALRKHECPIIGNVSGGSSVEAHAVRDENASLGVSAAADFVAQECGNLVDFVVEGRDTCTKHFGLVDAVGEEESVEDAERHLEAAQDGCDAHGGKEFGLDGEVSWRSSLERIG